MCSGTRHAEAGDCSAAGLTPDALLPPARLPTHRCGPSCGQGCASSCSVPHATSSSGFTPMVGGGGQRRVGWQRRKRSGQRPAGRRQPPQRPSHRLTPSPHAPRLRCPPLRLLPQATARMPPVCVACWTREASTLQTVSWHRWAGLGMGVVMSWLALPIGALQDGRGGTHGSRRQAAGRPCSPCKPLPLTVVPCAVRCCTVLCGAGCRPRGGDGPRPEETSHAGWWRLHMSCFKSRADGLLRLGTASLCPRPRLRLLAHTPGHTRARCRAWRSVRPSP